MAACALKETHPVPALQRVVQNTQDIFPLSGVTKLNSNSWAVITWSLLSAPYTDQDFHERVHMEETIDKSAGNRVAADQSLILDQQGNKNPIT